MQSNVKKDGTSFRHVGFFAFREIFSEYFLSLFPFLFWNSELKYKSQPAMVYICSTHMNGFFCCPEYFVVRRFRIFFKLRLFLLLNKICISVKLLLISYSLRSDDYRNNTQHHFQYCLLTQLSHLSAPVFMQYPPPSL